MSRGATVITDAEIAPNDDADSPLLRRAGSHRDPRRADWRRRVPTGRRTAGAHLTADLRNRRRTAATAVAAAVILVVGGTHIVLSSLDTRAGAGADLQASGPGQPQMPVNVYRGPGPESSGSAEFTASASPFASLTRAVDSSNVPAGLRRTRPAPAAPSYGQRPPSWTAPDRRLPPTAPEGDPAFSSMPAPSRSGPNPFATHPTTPTGAPSSPVDHPTGPTTPTGPSDSPTGPAENVGSTSQTPITAPTSAASLPPVTVTVTYASPTTPADSPSATSLTPPPTS